jgi:glucosamine--fructose-6-phosphate aminotransferase (isomerizing)
MLKEIHEQPRAVEDTLRGRVDLGAGDVVGEEIGIPGAREVDRRVYFVACGTSAHAAMAGRYWVEQLARVPAWSRSAARCATAIPVFGPDDLVVAVSQSGETLDTLAAVKTAKARGAHILAVANVIDSAIPRISDAALYTHAGPEIGVASTKCFTTQLAAMLLLAVYLGRRAARCSRARCRARPRGALAASRSRCARSSPRPSAHQGDREEVHLRARHALPRARHGLPHRARGALKLKEISYIHAEGYAAGEMKHGPIALIDEDMPVVVVCPKDRSSPPTTRSCSLPLDCALWLDVELVDHVRDVLDRASRSDGRRAPAPASFAPRAA